MVYRFFVKQKRREKMGRSAYKEYKLQEALLELQQPYDIAAEDRAMEHQEELFEITSPKNRVRQLKEAGLNPALMYGMGGGGGATLGNVASSPTKMTGVGTATAAEANKINAIKAGQQFLLEAGKVSSEIELNKATAEKQKADAEATKQVTIPKGEVEIEKLGQEVDKLAVETKNESIKGKGFEIQNDILAIERKIKDTTKFDQMDKIIDEAREIANKADKLEVEIDNLMIDNDVKSKTKDLVVKEKELTVKLIAREIVYKCAQTELTERQKKAVDDYLDVRWQELMNDQSKINATIEAALISANATVNAAQISAGGNLFGKAIDRVSPIKGSKGGRR